MTQPTHPLSFPLSFVVFFLSVLAAQGEPATDKETMAQAFEQAASGPWEVALEDPATIGRSDWTERWFLDGRIASAENTPDGLHLAAGPRFREDSHHMVLWTKQSFSGDVRLDFEYTRTDFARRAVNIVYIQATGSGKGPYAKDIREWVSRRETPAMSKYFRHMNLYHVSFAAFGPDWDSETPDYVRARRYLPSLEGLVGSELSPDYKDTGLFQPGVRHSISVIKVGQELFMRVVSPSKTEYFHWKNDEFPPVEEGRIGFRLMYTRSALYRNISISTRPANTDSE